MLLRSGARPHLLRSVLLEGKDEREGHAHDDRRCRGRHAGLLVARSPLGISHFLFGLICSTITMFVANSIFYKKGEDKAA